MSEPAISPTRREDSGPVGARRGLHRLGGAVVDLVFPPRCASCWAPLAHGAQPLLCRRCAAAFTADAVDRCPLCAADLGPETAGEFCVHCYGRKLRFDAAVALGGYRAELRDAVLRTKRPRDEPLAPALAELVWRRHAAQLQAWNIDAVVAVPMHWRRRLARGVNGPDVLAEVVARRLSLPQPRKLLRRRRATREQFHLEHDDRLRNVRGAFVARRPKFWSGRRILVVDDILTSGATCSEAARMLKRAGAAWVAVAVVARAQNPLE